MNGNDPWLGEPMRNNYGRDSNIDRMSRGIGGGGKITSGRPQSTSHYAR